MMTLPDIFSFSVPVSDSAAPEAFTSNSLSAFTCKYQRYVSVFNQHIDLKLIKIII